MITAVLAAADASARRGSCDHKTIGYLDIAAVFTSSAAYTRAVYTLSKNRTASDNYRTALFRVSAGAYTRARSVTVRDRVDFAVVNIDRAVFAASAAADSGTAGTAFRGDLAAVDRDGSDRPLCFNAASDSGSRQIGTDFKFTAVERDTFAGA